jgi:hypothetical protein
LSAIAFWTAGSATIAVGMGWISFPPKALHVPRWVIALTGLAFAAAGFAPLATRLGRYARVSQAAALVAFASLAVIVNWVAFGPGPRQFAGGISVGGFAIASPSGSEIGGRVMFGVGAVILDLIVLAVLASKLRGKNN